MLYDCTWFSALLFYKLYNNNVAIDDQLTILILPQKEHLLPLRTTSSRQRHHRTPTRKRFRAALSARQSRTQESHVKHLYQRSRTFNHQQTKKSHQSWRINSRWSRCITGPLEVTLASSRKRSDHQWISSNRIPTAILPYQMLSQRGNPPHSSLGHTAAQNPEQKILCALWDQLPRIKHPTVGLRFGIQDTQRTQQMFSLQQWAHEKIGW